MSIMQTLLAIVKVAASVWDIKKATVAGTPINFFDVSSEEEQPTGLAFKSDGTKMYITGDVTASPDVPGIVQYNLSTAWDVSTASFSVAFNTSSQDSRPQDLRFKPDGTKMYVIAAINDRVYEYDLSTAWDLATASFNQHFSVGSEESVPMSLFFKPDGTKMFIIGINGDEVNEYDLSTAWDISTASYSQNFSVSTQDNSPRGLFFKSDGTVMYLTGTQGQDINEYSLSTAWDVSTASYSRNFALSNQGTGPFGLFFKSDGTEFFTIDRYQRYVFKYDLSTAYNVTTASFSYPTTKKFDVSSQEISPGGLSFKPDGTKMYICGTAGDDINEYDLSTAWDVGTASFNQNFSVFSEEANPAGMFFKPDGTKVYILGAGDDAIVEYDLSTAWDISTASHNQSFDVSTQEHISTGLYFRSDGLKVFTIGTENDRVYEYNLTTAWDVSTASFNQFTSISSQESNPQDVFFKSDGTKMYIIGRANNRVIEYTLSTAWDISTRSSSFSTKDLRFLESSCNSIFFKPDGDGFFIVGLNNDTVWSFDIS